MTRLLAFALLLSSLVLAAAAGPAGAQPANQPPGPRVLVRFGSGADPGERTRARDRVDAELVDVLGVPGLQAVELPAGASPRAAAARLERDPDVRYAEPVVSRRALADPPPDEFFGQLYALRNTGQNVRGATGTPGADLDVLRAWDTTFGDPATVVAVVDTGVDTDHPELRGTVASNPGEAGGQAGVDDDGNGLVDDVGGWDFVGDRGSATSSDVREDDREDPDPRDVDGHGTHVAGTIAARSSSFGIVGVAPRVSVLPVRVLGHDGSGTSQDVIEGLDYAGDREADVVNVSLGGEGLSQAEYDAIASHPQTLYAVAAGNDGPNATPGYPCAHPLDNIVCVAATDQNDRLASFSTRGAESVDLAAPGVNVLSDQPSRQTRFSESFEASSGAWTSGGSPGGTADAPGPTWAVTAGEGLDGSAALSDSPGTNYANNANQFSRTTSPVDLTGLRGCQLLYEMRTDLADDDYVSVEAAQSASGPWRSIDAWGGSTQGRFFSGDADLGLSDGRPSTYVRFRLRSNAAGTAGGVQVDDVRVRCVNPAGGGAFAYLNGTSMATPHVAGVAALLRSQTPGRPVSSLREALLGSVDCLVEDERAAVGSGGRVKAAAALAYPATRASCPVPTRSTTTSPSVATTVPSGEVAGVTPPTGQIPPAPLPRDVLAPRASLAFARAQTLATLRRGGLRVTVRCSEACAGTVRLDVDRTTARLLGLRRGRPLGTARLRVTRGGASTRILVRLPRSVRTRLARLSRLRFVTRLHVSDAAGNDRSITRRATLRRR